MHEAARTTDPTVHVGTIAQGASHTFIGGLPAARRGDPHVCPAHVGGVIVEGSSTVFIEGAQAARKGHLCGCNAAGRAGAGCPAALGPAGGAAPLQVSTDGLFNQCADNNIPARGPYAEARLLDSDGDGVRDTASADAALLRMRNQGFRDVGGVELGARHELDAFSVSGRASYSRGDRLFGAGNPYNAGSVSGKASATTFRQGGSLLFGPAGDNGRNPMLELGGEYRFFHAEAEGDALLGDDGRRVGFRLMGKAGAEVVGGDVSGRRSIAIPLIGWTIDARVKGGAAAGLSGGGGLWAFFDRQTERFHIGALGELVLGLDIDISIGRPYREDPPDPNQPPGADGRPVTGSGSGGVPNAIAEGCPTVFIGG
ncbi:Zn-binding Pro-Ala-Ala-Arg (PAAR) domain-containing protein, incolved in TypeVI secretion [Nannocystis exedens]|uniref:Zn-binding Pro-Ala-Ala-Arg (PAAR) domain-containing protein, incolved in TypeVI secretion n=1 Tax=Nannocystis exedens TaxID=54 RepID=A0A1I2IP66_9BACT|nr:PAAR domain-containing protein [Nannocystis exedens]PCC68143.1 PAAR motif protein [Nannocystis exedens]SFF43428.1 Zn-binding Pro-Ala-Ala-Arg (PAAR) domain-containing protein, incolved in TypeVI secretion [Nannocystis exedens]